MRVATHRLHGKHREEVSVKKKLIATVLAFLLGAVSAYFANEGIDTKTAEQAGKMAGEKAADMIEQKDK